MTDPVIKVTAVDATKAAFESVKGGLAGIHTKAVSVTGALAALGAGAALADLTMGIRKSIEELDELGKGAQRVGFGSAQSLAEFQFAAKLAGVESEKFENALTKLNGKMADAASGNKEAVALFGAMGVKVKDTTGQLRSAESVLMDMAKLFPQWKDSVEKSALAGDLFGDKIGRVMIPLLNGGAEALEKTRAEFRALRGTIDDGATKSAEQFNDNLTRLGVGAGKLTHELAAGLLPTLVKITDQMVEATKQGGFLKGALAGIQTLFTGDDRHKANVEMVESAERILQIQNAMDKIRGKGTANQTANDLRALANLQGELATQQERYSRAHGYAGLLDNGVNGPKPAADDTKPAAPIAQKQVSTAAAKESAYAAVNKAVQTRLDLMNEELSKGRQLTELEKLEVQWNSALEQSKQKVTEAEWAQHRAKIEQIKQAELAQKVQRSQDEEELARAKERQRLKAEGYAESEKILALEQTRHDTAQRTLADIEFEISLLGMDNKQREMAITLRELENQGIKEGTPAWEKYGAAIMAAVEKRGALQQQMEQFRNIWESVDRTAHDVFVNIFEGGKTAFTKLRDTLKATLLDLLYQMTVKKWVFNLTASVTGTGAGVANAAVGADSPLAQAGGLANLGTLASSASSLLGAGASATLQNGLISGFGANMANIGTLVSGGSYMTALSAAAPYLLPVLAIATMLSGKFKGETRVGGQYSNLGLLGAPSGGTINGASDAIGTTIGSINQTLEALGSSNRVQQLLSGLEQSEKGMGFAYAGGFLSSGASFGQYQNGYMNRRGSKSAEQALSEFGEELKQATLQALQAADVPGQIGDYLRQLGDVDALSGGALDDALKHVNDEVLKQQNLRAAKLQMERTLLELTSTAEENLARARREEREAMDESLRGLYDQIVARQDETKAAEEAKRVYETGVETARQTLAVAYQREGDTLRSVIDRHKGYVESLKSFQRQLAAGPQALLTPQAQYEADKRRFDEIAARALGRGDEDAIAQLQEAADDFLRSSQAWQQSTPGYFRDLEAVKRAVEGARLSSMATVDVAKLQLNALDQMVGGLLPAQITATLSVREAIEALRVAMAKPTVPLGAAGSGFSSVPVVGHADLSMLVPDAANSLAGGFGYSSADLLGRIQGYADSGTPFTEIVRGLIQSDVSPERVMAAYLDQTGQGLSGEMATYLVDTYRQQRALLDGSHAAGLAHVPRDGYVAELHYGESVRTAAQTASDRQVPAMLKAMSAQLEALTAVVAEYANRDLAIGNAIRANTEQSNKQRLAAARADA